MRNDRSMTSVVKLHKQNSLICWFLENLFRRTGKQTRSATSAELDLITFINKSRCATYVWKQTNERAYSIKSVKVDEAGFLLLTYNAKRFSRSSIERQEPQERCSGKVRREWLHRELTICVQFTKNAIVSIVPFSWKLFCSSLAHCQQALAASKTG